MEPKKTTLLLNDLRSYFIRRESALLQETAVVIDLIREIDILLDEE